MHLLKVLTFALRTAQVLAIAGIEPARVVSAKKPDCVRLSRLPWNMATASLIVPVKKRSRFAPLRFLGYRVDSITAVSIRAGIEPANICTPSCPVACGEKMLKP